MSKVEFFFGINSAVKAFHLNQSSFLICVLFWLFRGYRTDNIQYIPLQCCKTKGIFQES